MKALRMYSHLSNPKVAPALTPRAAAHVAFEEGACDEIMANPG